MPKEPKAAGLRVYRRKGTPTLYIRGVVKVGDKIFRIYESAGTADPELARQACQSREAAIFRGAIHGFPEARVTWADAALSYLTHEPRSAATHVFVQRLTRAFGATKACRDIDQVAIDAAARALCRPGAKPATRLRNVVAPARAVLMHAARRGWCDAPRFEAAASSAARTEFFTPAEAEALIAAATGRQAHMRALLTFLFCTGCRLGEALELDWADVTLTHARAVLRDTKNGADRHVDLLPRLVAELANLSHRTGAVFRARGRSYRATDDSRTVAYGGQVRKAWATCMERACITRHLTPHHARHTWASWHYALHRDLLLLKRDGGWATVSQVERYAHIVPASMRPEVERFWGVSGAGAVQAPELVRKTAG